MRILLVNTGFRKPLHPLVTPPLGIMYLASYIRSKFNVSIRLINQKLNNDSNDSIIQSAKDFGADIIGLSVLSTAAHGLPYLTEKIKAALPGSLIVLGGPHVSSFETRSMKGNSADVAVPGEGEVAFEKVIRSYVNKHPFSDIPGIYWRDDSGMVVHNPGTLPLIDDLDTLPFPAYDLIDLPKYWAIQSMPPVPRRRYASLFSSRGCPYKCIYCHNIFGSTFRFHSAERIIAEIEYIKKKYSISDFEFLDDIFNLNRERLVDFASRSLEKDLGLELAFPNGVRTDLLRKEEIDMLVESGLYFSSFALESGSPRIQKLIGKNLNIEKFRENVLYAVSRGVFSNGFAMFGFPTETAGEMQMTIDVICASRLHTASFFTVTPFPNTELYRIMEKNSPEKLGLVNYDNMEYSMALFNLSAVSDRDIYRFQRKANIRMLLNPMRLFRIIRDIPRPYYLPLYLPEFLKRITKGLFLR
ncbi:MAG: B12-binding domain-containing radical SAM protein [Spirochaetes bacterium]|nr:B12-binding domain-containing radical SAM protein [Spirochaetota bacterium]